MPNRAGADSRRIWRVTPQSTPERDLGSTRTASTRQGGAFFRFGQYAGWIVLARGLIRSWHCRGFAHRCALTRALRTKKSRLPAAFFARSLDLAFLVFDVLPDDGVVLHEDHLFRGVLLVLRGRVEMTGARGGNQAVLIALACHVRSP